MEPEPAVSIARNVSISRMRVCVQKVSPSPWVSMMVCSDWVALAAAAAANDDDDDDRPPPTADEPAVGRCRDSISPGDARGAVRDPMVCGRGA